MLSDEFANCCTATLQTTRLRIFECVNRTDLRKGWSARVGRHMVFSAIPRQIGL